MVQILVSCVSKFFEIREKFRKTQNLKFREINKLKFLQSPYSAVTYFILFYIFYLAFQLFFLKSHTIQTVGENAGCKKDY